uniref:Uncharacterized protein n=1 Tax=Solanum lycopersicum TaxID=4081 RepID=A0A3Q7HH14_SOLLC
MTGTGPGNHVHMNSCVDRWSALGWKLYRNNFPIAAPHLKNKGYNQCLNEFIDDTSMKFLAFNNRNIAIFRPYLLRQHVFIDEYCELRLSWTSHNGFLMEKFDSKCGEEIHAESAAKVVTYIQSGKAIDLSQLFCNLCYQV